MKKALAGITSTGNLTLGNYIGAIKPMIDLQNEYDLFIFVADLHSLTTPIGKDELKENTENVLKLYKACGINTNKVRLFKQSDIDEHLVLNYLLQVNTTMGELSRMTQFKDKSVKNSNGTEMVPTGLFLYPVLQAADILLYNPDYVIVGEDQEQHIELTRTLAKRINSKYKLKLTSPSTLVPKVGKRIMSLTDPSSKMSKSDENKKGTIFLLDSDKDIRKKIMSSMTDSENKVKFDPINKPGVSNLITIYASLSNTTIEEAEEKLKNYDYKEFKETIADKVVETVSGIRESFNRIEEIDFLATVEIKEIAKKNIKEIKESIGI